MLSPNLLIVIGAGIIGIVLILFVTHRISQELRSRERLLEVEDDYLEEQEAEQADQGGQRADEEGGLVRWLFLAGYRTRNAQTMFIVVMAAVFFGGLILAIGLTGSKVTRDMAEGLSELPGGFAKILLPVIVLSPWIMFAILVSIPIVIVRSARRTRVRLIELDMPITLELLATLGQSGLGFDASIARILRSQPADRPLSQELRIFQLEALSGVSRIQCYRHLAQRIDVPSMSIFVSALVQAEQIGAGYAEVLRRQADDLRNRRRENVVLQAQALPVKLVFPLVICFLPGIFVGTLGPTFYQFFELAESVIQGTR